MIHNLQTETECLNMGMNEKDVYIIIRFLSPRDSQLSIICEFQNINLDLRRIGFLCLCGGKRCLLEHLKLGVIQNGLNINRGPEPSKWEVLHLWSRQK